MDSVKRMGVGLFSLGLILFVVVGGYNVLALNIGTVTGDYFKGALAVCVLLGGTWLSLQGVGFIGKPFVVGALIALVVITVRHRAPGVADLVAQSSAELNRSAENAAIDLSAPREIPCDASTPNVRFFRRSTGEKLVWAAETDNGRIICYDRPGHHPQTNKDLVAVDERLAAVILRQEPPTPKPSDTTMPTFAGSHDVALLGDGPIQP